MKLLFLGSQGSGKSTQAKLLADYLQIPVVSTGDIFRKISEDNSEVGKRIAEIVKSGELVEDKEVSAIINKRLQEKDCQNGFILDGYPRSVAQIKYFDPGFDKVIFLTISKETAINRLLKRGRVDDTSESIKTRLENYYRQIEQIISYYQQKDKIIEINAERPVNDIQTEIRRKFI